jgi:molecular chaperone IbpA
MTTYDFAPLFRTAIGFDRLARLMDTATSAPDASSYPPYNIERTGEDTYRLTMAVAGFRPEELDLMVKDNTMVVSGKASNEGQTGEMLYRGIAGRAFERRFVPPTIVVDGADLQNGLLHAAEAVCRGTEAAPDRDRRQRRQGSCERQLEAVKAA